MKRLLPLFVALAFTIGAGQAVRAEGPARIAIAGGVLTEIAFLLGAQDRIVGVDATSKYPTAAQSKPQLGYFRRISAEGVLSLTPDLLLAAAHAGPPTSLAQIEAAGVSIRVAPDITEVAALPDQVRFVGAALAETEAASKLADRLVAELAQLEDERPKDASPRILFVLAVRSGAPLVAGRETGPASVIASAGGVNVAEFEGFKPMSPEDVLASRPDILMMTEEHSARLGGAEAVAASLLFGDADTTQPKTVTVPALTVLSIGPRTPDSIRRLRARF